MRRIHCERHGLVCSRFVLLGQELPQHALDIGCHARLPKGIGVTELQVALAAAATAVFESDFRFCRPLTSVSPNPSGEV